MTRSRLALLLALSLVGGTAAGGYLFTVDTDTQEVKPWGRPTDGTEIRALVHAGKTGFWGLAVTPGQTTRIFNFRPDRGILKDHGVPVGSLEQDDRQWTWHAHRIADMAVLPDGRILLAERANQAKLLVFEPPPPPPEAPETPEVSEAPESPEGPDVIDASGAGHERPEHPSMLQPTRSRFAIQPDNPNASSPGLCMQPVRGRDRGPDRCGGSCSGR